MLTVDSLHPLTEEQRDLIHALYTAADLSIFIEEGIDRLTHPLTTGSFTIEVSGHRKGFVLIGFDHYDENTWAIEYTFF